MYETYHSLTLISGPEEDYNKLLEEIRLIHEVDLEIGESTTHFDAEDVLCEMTGKYPTVLVELSGDGDDREDSYLVRFLAGRSSGKYYTGIAPFREMLTPAEAARNLSEVLEETRAWLCGFIGANAETKEDLSCCSLTALEEKANAVLADRWFAGLDAEGKARAAGLDPDAPGSAELADNKWKSKDRRARTAIYRRLK